MTEAPDPPRRRAPALEWPIDWSKDEKFWREVATRTVAGMLALVFLGAPTVIYLMLSGGLSARVGVPILIGIGMVFVVGIVWWVTRFIVRLVERRQLRKAVETDPAVDEDRSRAALQGWVEAWMESRRAAGDPFGEDLERAFTPRRELSEATRARMEKIARLSGRWTAVLSTALSAVLVAGIPILLEFFWR